MKASRASARMPANVVPCRPVHLMALAEAMRRSEQAQLLAVMGRPVYDPDTAIHWLVDTWAQSAPYAFTVVSTDGMPAAAGGFHPVVEGVWQAWMVGTEAGWGEQWRAMTKATRWLMDLLLATRAHRLQTCALSSRVKAIEWFERSLGMQPEGVWRGYGINGEGIAHFSKLRGE